jgi:hypothetical protein
LIQWYNEYTSTGVLVGIRQGVEGSSLENVLRDSIKIGEFLKSAYKVGFPSNDRMIDTSEEASVDPGLDQIGGFDEIWYRRASEGV